MTLRFRAMALLIAGTAGLAPAASFPEQRPQLGPAPRIGKPPAVTAAPRAAAAPQAAGGWVDITDREAVRQFYLTGYVPLQNFPMGWTGNLAGGIAGDTSPGYKNAVIALVNFFRSLAGVPPVITVDPATSPKAQLAALMFAANNALSHNPPMSWIDYSADGALAAGNSNICLDTQLPLRPGCVENYMEDSGANNAAAGHRRWILYPQTTRMGTGDIPPGDPAHPFGANDLWVINSDEVFGPRPATRQEFVAWPPPGYVPQQFVFTRWSFAYHDADLSNAAVTMTRNGSPVPLTQQPVQNGFGENTLVWEVQAVSAPGHAVIGGDVATHVTVSNVIVNSVARQFSYDVIAFDPSQATVSARTISHIANGSGFRTTIILVNTGSASANFTLNFWAEDGASLPLDFGPDGVTAQLAGALQPGVARFMRTAGIGTLQKGWAELIAPGSVDGNSIFGLQSLGQGDSEAAVPLSPAGGTQLFLPFDNTPGYVTGVAFANPSQLGASVSGSFRDDSGNPLADPDTVTVKARGHASEVLGTYFPSTQGKRGAAAFSSSVSVFSLGIRANGKAFTSIEALSGVTAAGKTIAHIADGGGWKTAFLLVNTGAQPANFTLSFFDDNGNPLALPLGSDGFVSSLTAAIQPGALRVVQTTGANSTLASGWAQLAVTGPISGTAIFGLQTSGQADSEAAVPFSTTGSTSLYMPYDYTPGYSTGIALTNPSLTQSAHATVSFVDDAGNSRGSLIPVTVSARGHVALVLRNLSSAIDGTRGTVSIVSEVPIFGLGIRANGQAFTSLKVIAK